MNATITFAARGVMVPMLTRFLTVNSRDELRREFDKIVNNSLLSGNLARVFGAGSVVTCSAFIGAQSRAAYVRRPIVWSD